MFGLDMIYFQLILLGVFAIATVVGYLLIKNVPSLLHTPLMSGMNALSGVTVIGALTATAGGFFAASIGSVVASSIFGIIAIALAMINVVGGFAVTDRMLSMIAKKKAPKQTLIYGTVIALALAVFATIGCFTLMGDIAQYVYLVLCIILSVGVLVGIALMGKVSFSKIGNRVSAVCMLLAIILTVGYTNHYTVYTAYPIYIGLALGGGIGYYLAKKVSMLQMPQMVALLNGLGGAASALLGAFAMFGIGAELGYFEKITSAIALAVGMLTLTGSLVAAGKLHKVIPQKSVVWKHHPLIQLISVIIMLVGIVVFVVLGATNSLGIVGGMFAVILLTSGFFGFAFAIRVGGADMPITISLLNSLSGVAGAIAGLAIGDLLLVAVGGIVGASGLLLTQIMCKAMNRSLIAILTGKTTSQPSKGGEKSAQTANASKDAPQKAVEENKTESNPAIALNSAKEVIIVPGYGMAIAQAQHVVKQLADKLVANGTVVKYAVHPVAGRMPGHMNVLLCEADVDYEDLFEMDDINPEFEKADATIVVGANDVMNPAARHAEGTPIYGMPVLDVDKCKNIFVFNFDLKPGYAGVENPIYTKESGVHLYLGNAADTVQQFINEMDKPFESVGVAKVEIDCDKNYAKDLLNAKEVIIVPGYGMAIAQAQHVVKQLADKLVANGTVVKYAVHPVAGRMPGHMNVLLCEADVDYEDLFEMDDINPEFEKADATIVVGANDVMNPAARHAEGTPIYGMPVLDVDKCKNIFVFNFDLKPGYAGVENPIYTKESGVHLYLGNAADTLKKFISDINN